jgi:methylmalonyl-CoA mutase N-terminal domain/subunit
MTDEMERQAELVFSHLDDLGRGSILEGVYAAIDNGWFQREIADASYQLERKINNDRRIVVGVNAFTDAGDDDPLAILSIGHEVEERQLKRLDDVKHRRDQAVLDAALARVAADAAQPDVNLMPAILDAVRGYATVGELVDSLVGVFGRWAEDPVF